MAEGVWGTSPHLIPHFALHSASGTISLALGLHGPNLGVGGGLHAAAEGFPGGPDLAVAGVVPGVWLVLTGWSPELVPDPGGNGSARRRMPGPGPGAWRLPASRPAGRRSGPSSERIVTTRAAPLDLARLAESSSGRGEPSPRTIATDPSGRLRVELVEGSDGPG